MTRWCNRATEHGPFPNTQRHWDQRILLIFSRFWYLILFTWRVFLSFKFSWVVNNTFFCGVTNSEHTFNIDFTRTLISRNCDFLAMWLNISQLQPCFLQLQPCFLQCDLYFTIVSFCQYDSICLNCTHMVTYLTTATLFPSIVTIYRNCDYIMQGNLMVRLLFFSQLWLYLHICS